VKTGGYHAVLMDIQMPVMNGLEATREIRKFLPKIPVIALTAFSHEEDKENWKEAGCTDYLSKPLEKAVMLDKINSYL